MNIRSIDQAHLHQNILKEIDKIHSSKILKKKDILLAGKNRTSDTVQRFIYHKNSDFYNRIFKPILCDAIFKAENQSEGAGEICLNITLEKIEEGLQQIVLGEHKDNIKKNITDDINKLLLQAHQRIINPTSDDISKLLKEFISRESHIEIFDILLNSGITTSPVFIEKSHKRETVIDIQPGFIFNIGTESDFLLGRSRWKRKNVSCLVIDGIIESIGEIHHLLEKASQDKNPYVLFIRGMSDEVSNTIKLNLSRGTIDIMPVCVGFDESTLNILNDIAICTGSHLVSSYTGDLISKASMGPFPIIPKIDISKNKLSIISEPDRDIISSHLNYLNDKKSNMDSPEVRELISNRIKSMTAGKIVLNVGSDLLSEQPLTIEIFDKCLRSISSAMKEGLIECDNLDISRYIPSRKIVPSLSIFFGLFFSKSCIQSILSLGHCLIADD